MTQGRRDGAKAARHDVSPRPPIHHPTPEQQDRLLEQQREYRRKSEQRPEYKARRREYMNQWRAEHREEYRAYNRQWMRDYRARQKEGGA